MENKGLIIIIVGLIFSITIYGIFIGIPLIILGTYLLNKKINNPTEEIEKQIKNKQEKLENINHKYEKLSEKKEKELDTRLKDKQDSLDKLNEKYLKLEQEKTNDLNAKLKNKQDQLKGINLSINRKEENLQNLDIQEDILEVGLYTPQYDFLTSLEYKDKLEEVRKKQKEE